ncbi:hypothetical protein LguiB_014111 [Lonicera macranthoides]
MIFTATKSSLEDEGFDVVVLENIFFFHCFRSALLSFLPASQEKKEMYIMIEKFESRFFATRDIIVKLGSVLGGFVVNRSRECCKTFILKPASKKKLLDDTRSTVYSLPGPMVINGSRIVFELLVWIDLEIRRRPHNNVSSTARISSRPRTYPKNNAFFVRTNNMKVAPILVSHLLLLMMMMLSYRRFDHCRAMMAKFTMKQLERIRVASAGMILE